MIIDDVYKQNKYGTILENMKSTKNQTSNNFQIYHRNDPRYPI